MAPTRLAAGRNRSSPSVTPADYYLCMLGLRFLPLVGVFRENPSTKRRMTRNPSIVFAALLITWAGALSAQPSPRVPLTDPVYEVLDQVIGSGLVRTVIYGERPYTRREIGRIVAEASAHAKTRQVSRSTTAQLARLNARFADEKDRPAVQWVSADVIGLDSPSRDIPPAPVGAVAADLNPLLNGRGGRRFGQGPTFATEASTIWSLGRHLLITAQPRVALGGTGASRFAEASMQELSVAGSLGNLVAEVGRQPLIWGPGIDGGLMLSSSGRPLDMIRVSTAAPWRAPWVFKWLGLLRATGFLADLGPRQNFPNAKVAAYKLSGQVTSYFELAAAVLVHEGGRGAPEVSLYQRFIDLVPALKYTLPNSTVQFSNKLAGWDMRFRIPKLHGLQLYSEHVFDDMDPRRWKSTLWQDGGHVVGASLAQLGSGGGVVATAEFHHTGLRFYQHTPFTSGITFNRTLLGDPLGPQGDGGYLRFRHDGGGSTSWRLDAAVERRGGDSWGTTSDTPGDANFRFVLVQQRPAEWRQRLALQWSLAPTVGQRFTLQTGVERVRDAGFVAGARRMNSMLGAQWTWNAW